MLGWMPVRSRRISSMLIVAFLLLLIVPMAIWFATAESRRVSIEVQRLVSEMNDEFSEETRAAQNKLIALGPNPELRRILISRTDTSGAQWYARVWNMLPASARAQLPEPRRRAALRRNLQQCLANVGPVICRAMTGAVCTALESDDATGAEMTLLRNLIWCIPESTRALTTLSNYLARPENNFLFGSVYADELWPKMPDLAPLLAQWLRNEHTVNDAARGLAQLGTNAAFALPLLIEVAEIGVASPTAHPRIKVSYGPGIDPVAMRRIVAIKALGKIGVTNAAVMQALNKAAESGNNELCSAAYLAVLQLDLPITTPLQTWADQWNPFEEFSAQMFRASETLRSLGKLGQKGARAIPLLNRVASGNGTNAAARFDHFDPRQADGMRVAAISSLYQIDPSHAAPYVPFLLEQSANWEAFNLLSQWREMREQIVPTILEQLNDPNRRLRAAFILHGVAPELEKPRRILESALGSDNLETKGTAVNLLWRLRQDVDPVLPVARELLKASDDNSLQSALNVLEKMGDAARPAIPELKPLLTSPHWGVRDRAGRLLRQLSPADMPPIIE